MKYVVALFLTLGIGSLIAVTMIDSASAWPNGRGYNCTKNGRLLN